MADQGSPDGAPLYVLDRDTVRQQLDRMFNGPDNGDSQVGNPETEREPEPESRFSDDSDEVVGCSVPRHLVSPISILSNRSDKYTWAQHSWSSSPTLPAPLEVRNNVASPPPQRHETRPVCSYDALVQNVSWDRSSPTLVPEEPTFPAEISVPADSPVPAESFTMEDEPAMRFPRESWFIATILLAHLCAREPSPPDLHSQCKKPVTDESQMPGLVKRFPS